MSNNVLTGSLFFLAGAAIASFVTYKTLNKKYKDIADEEIESVRQLYERKLNKAKTDNKVVEHETEKVEDKNSAISINPYSSLVNDLGYSEVDKEEKNVTINNNIEVISPEDFGEYGYMSDSLTYYADKVLTFYDDEVITDVERYVGSRALNTFGEYEDDSVFVRNHDMKMDYEILLDNRRFSDVASNKTINDTSDDD